MVVATKKLQILKFTHVFKPVAEKLYNCFRVAANLLPEHMRNIIRNLSSCSSVTAWNRGQCFCRSLQCQSDFLDINCHFVLSHWAFVWSFVRILELRNLYYWPWKSNQYILKSKWMAVPIWGNLLNTYLKYHIYVLSYSDHELWPLTKYFQSLGPWVQVAPNFEKFSSRHCVFKNRTYPF